MKSLHDLSLGWRTHLIFPRFDAEVTARDDCIVVRTPHNPTFWWGNFILFDHAPAEGDAARWIARFDEEIAAGQPLSRHVAIGVDCAGPLAMPADFAAAGFEMHAGTVLTMRRDQLRAPPAPLDARFTVRMLTSDDNIASAVDSQVAADEGVHGDLGYREFRELQMRRYGAMARAGLGAWFGVVTRAETGGEQVVADCGLFRDSPGPGALGRFQHVSTHPAWRRRGLCRALIHAVCRHGFEALGLATLAIVANPEDVAIGLYEAVGFERGASTWNLERRPPPRP